MKFLICSLLLTVAVAFAGERPRLLVLTDIGGDPDDQQSMVRLMVYANEFNLEGLVASASGTPGQLKTSVTRPDLIREIVGAYGKVRPNLAQHGDGCQWFVCPISHSYAETRNPPVPHAGSQIEKSFVLRGSGCIQRTMD